MFYKDSIQNWPGAVSPGRACAHPPAQAPPAAALEALEALAGLGPAAPPRHRAGSEVRLGASFFGGGEGVLTKGGGGGGGGGANRGC